MNLRARSRVSALLRGQAFPADDNQVTSLIRALGGGAEDVARGLRLYRKIRSSSLGVTASSEKSVDPLPGAVEETEVSPYTAVVRSIAPAELEDRQRELAELFSFCAGEEQYLWLQAPPWAGKTALLSWFALHPPPDVVVVSFFVTSRLAGQSDAQAFIEVMIDQLSAIARTSISQAMSVTARHGVLLDLVESAVIRLQASNRQLVLVVDGLDEDQGSNPSIACLLPRRPPAGLRVIASGRTHPGVPHDVPGDHPLRNCPRRLLSPSPHAANLATQAEAELLDRLHGSSQQQDVIALITASGGGLTARDLAELTGQQGFAIRGEVNSTFGRSLERRVNATGEHVYLFAHETLQAAATEVLGEDLLPFEERVDDWAGTYRAGGWPETTPSYLLRPYSRHLAARGDLRRLAELAADSAHNDLLLHRTGSDAAAIGAIVIAQRGLMLEADGPDLLALTVLAVEDTRLAGRNFAIPDQLIQAWLRLGDHSHARELMLTMADPLSCVAALLAVAAEDEMWADMLMAEAVMHARAIEDTRSRTQALAWVALTAYSIDRNQAKTFLAEAESAAADIAHPVLRASPLAAVIQAAAKVEPSSAIRLLANAEAAARTIADPAARAWALAVTATAAADTDPARVRNLVTEAEQAAGDHVRGPDELKELLKASCWALARVGQLRKAEAVARMHPFPGDQAQLLAQVVATVGRGHPIKASRLITEAEKLAGALPGPGHCAQTLACIASAVVEADPERAATLAAQACQVAAGISDLPGPAAVAITSALARTGQWQEAERAARMTSDPEDLAWALAELATAIAGADPGRAARLATEAEKVARAAPRRHRQVRMEMNAVVALTESGEWDRCDQAVQYYTNPDGPDPLLESAASASALACLPERAETAAHIISNPDSRARVLARLATSLVDIDPDRAAILAAQAEQSVRIHTASRSKPLTQAMVATAITMTHTGGPPPLARDAEKRCS